MEIYEAAELVEAIAKSIAEDPSQFHFEINITGTRATSIGGGSGLSVQAIGGGPGSTTIGFQSSVNGVNVEIAQKAANAAIQKEMSALVQALNDLAHELRSTTPEKKRINAILEGLKQNWMPNVITSFVASIIARVAVS